MTQYIKYLIFFLLLVSIKLLAEPEIRLAVLPFKNVIKNEKYDWLSDGFCESLTTGLTQVESIRLIERSMIESVLKEQKRSKSDLFDPETAVELGRLLGANKVLVGSYQVLSEKILVNARIVDVATGEIAKNGAVGNLIEDYTNCFNLHVKLVGLVVQSFNLNLTQKEQSKITSVTTNSTQEITAYEAYVLGRNAFLLFTPYGYNRAIMWYQKAVEVDTKYALAHAGLASAYTYWGFERSWAGQSYKIFLQ